VDYDDDDTRDADEPFVDTNANGRWDDANGAWDASTNIFTRTIVVYSGMPATMTAGGMEYMSRWMEASDVSTYSAPTPVATFTIRPSFDPEKFDDQNGNNRYDAGEPFADTNGNGVYDAFFIAATQDILWVGAADANLNRLYREATYSLELPMPVGFTGVLNGKPNLPDRTGLGFAYRPCLASNTARCALDCPDLTSPTDARCVMRTVVGDYGYGYLAPVTFKGGVANTADGDTSAFFRIDLFGETLRIQVRGTHR
jgi:hypothetical protein